MKTVGDLLDIGLPLLWHEAVAVVQEVASHVSERGIPALSNFLFNEDGTMTVDAAGAGRLPVVPVLGRLLQRLLPDDAPTALSAFARENSAEQPSHPTLDTFTAALGFFERPGRAAHLLGVASRLEQYIPPSTTEEELDRLRKKVVDGPAEPPKAAPAARRSIHPAYLAGGALAVLVVIAGVSLGARLPVGPVVSALSRLTSSPMLSSSTAAPVAAQPTEEAAPGDVVNGKSESPAPHARAAERRKAVSHRVPSPSVRNGVSPVGAVVTTSVTTLNDFVSGDSSATRVATPVESNRETTARVDPARIYSSEDTGVTPAAFVRPQLPREPQPGPTTGLFDLTVDETGNVVSVRLLSPTGRYHDRSLVSAAKAWRFRPALLEGRPVKYRIRVPINVPGSQ